MEQLKKILNDLSMEEMKKIITNEKLNKFIDEVSSSLLVINKLSDKKLFLSGIQMYYVLLDNRSHLNGIISYYEYIQNKKEITELIKTCNPAWKKDIVPIEKKGKLIFKMPNIFDISNGERDLLTLISELAKLNFRYKNSQKDLIIVIDELFDYLDEANLMFAQYILINYCQNNKNKKNIYPIVLTHLNPYNFNAFISNKKKIYFLQEGNRNNINKEIKKIILNRGCKDISDDLDLYFLHYNPESVNLKEKFKCLGLELKYANAKTFQKTALKNLNKYCNDKNYVPFLVGLSLRIFLEKRIYNKLKSDINKEQYLITKGTKQKFEYAIEHGVEVSELYFLLGIIYNDIAHIKGDYSNKIDMLYNNLKNKQIKNIIKNIYFEINK